MQRDILFETAPRVGAVRKHGGGVKKPQHFKVRSVPFRYEQTDGKKSTKKAMRTLFAFQSVCLNRRLAANGISWEMYMESFFSDGHKRGRIHKACIPMDHKIEIPTSWQKAHSRQALHM